MPASYVVHLPVTTAVANRAGREIWGYNKFVAGIDIRSDGKNFSTILRDTENAVICSLEGSRGVSIPMPPADIVTFTLLNGRVIKTLIQVLTPFHASSGEGFVFKVGTSRHSMANNLRAVALDEARPRMCIMPTRCRHCCSQAGRSKCCSNLLQQAGVSPAVWMWHENAISHPPREVELG
jgi:hypothetical protein